MPDASDFQGWPDDDQIDADLHEELGRDPKQMELDLRLARIYLVHILAALHEIRDNPKKPKK